MPLWNSQGRPPKVRREYADAPWELETEARVHREGGRFFVYGFLVDTTMDPHQDSLARYDEACGYTAALNIAAELQGCAIEHGDPEELETLTRDWERTRHPQYLFACAYKVVLRELRAGRCPPRNRRISGLIRKVARGAYNNIKRALPDPAADRTLIDASRIEEDDPEDLLDQRQEMEGILLVRLAEARTLAQVQQRFPGADLRELDTILRKYVTRLLPLLEELRARMEP